MSSVAFPVHLPNPLTSSSPSSTGTAAFCYVVDSSFYGVPTFTPWTFLQQNVFNSISKYYGVQDPLYYLVQAVPILTLTQLPFVLHGFWLSFRRGTGVNLPGNDLVARGKLLQLRHVVVGTIVAYSLLSHKEWRFIHPLLPLFHIFASLSLVTLFRSSPSSSFSSSPSSPPPPPSKFYPSSISRPHFHFLLLSLLPAIYLNNFHAVGQVSSIDYLRSRQGDDLKSLAVLMPCHSVPWQSNLHRRDLELDEIDGRGGSGEGGKAWFITCEPPNLYVLLAHLLLPLSLN